MSSVAYTPTTPYYAYPAATPIHVDTPDTLPSIATSIPLAPIPEDVDNWENSKRPKQKEVIFFPTQLKNPKPYIPPKRLIMPLEANQEIPQALRDNLNPMQKMGVWMIENLYQRVGLKQAVWKYFSDNGMDVCAYVRVAKAQGHSDWQSCSQYTKMAIVRDGFFIGCLRGASRMLVFEPLLVLTTLFHHPIMNSSIAEHGKIEIPVIPAAVVTPAIGTSEKAIKQSNQFVADV